ncbi:MAG: VOC family protein [Sumerlaeia bacterium]
MTRSNPTPTLSLGHIGLNVTNLQNSLKFYSQTLGLEIYHVVDEPGQHFAFLGTGGQVRVTLWEQSEGRFDAARPGLHHLAFQVPSVADVAAFQARLKAADAEMIYDRIVSHDEGASSGGIFFRDPDGNRLEIYVADGVHSHAPATAAAPSCGFFAPSTA